MEINAHTVGNGRCRIYAVFILHADSEQKIDGRIWYAMQTYSQAWRDSLHEWESEAAIEMPSPGKGVKGSNLFKSIRKSAKGKKYALKSSLAYDLGIHRIMPRGVGRGGNKADPYRIVTGKRLQAKYTSRGSFVR